MTDFNAKCNSMRKVKSLPRKKILNDVTAFLQLATKKKH